MTLLSSIITFCLVGITMGWLFAYARSLKAEIGRLSGEMMAMRSEIHRHCAELPALSKRIENMERM